jgi:hypothetical protein
LPAWASARARRPEPGPVRRTARRGWAAVRLVVLTGLAGLLVAMVIATALGAIVIAITSHTP